MAYGPEVHGDGVSYFITVTHTPTQNVMNLNVYMNRADQTIPTEAQQDALFQTFLTKLGELNNVTIVATKRGFHSQSVTP